MATACISQLAIRERQSHLSYQRRASRFCPQTRLCAQPTGHRPTQDLPGFGFRTTQGCVHTEWSSVPPGAQFRQEAMGRRGEETGEKLPVSGWLSQGALSSEDPAEEGLDVENCGSGLVLCAVQTVSRVLWLVMLFSSSLLRGPSFPRCVSLADLSSVN